MTTYLVSIPFSNLESAIFAAKDVQAKSGYSIDVLELSDIGYAKAEILVNVKA